MKKKITRAVYTAAALLLYSTVNAQTNTFPANGNVGIGTVTPQTKLDVTGTVQVNSASNPIRFSSANASFIGATTNRAEISNDTGTYKTLMIMGNKSAGLGRRVSVWDRLEVNGKLFATGYIHSTHPSNPRYYFITNDAETYSNRVIDVLNGDFRFYKEGAPEGTQIFATIKANGRVGIGTSNPQKLLDVNGDADVNGVLSANSLIASSTGNNPYVSWISNNATTYSNRYIDVVNGDFRFYKAGAPEGTQVFATIKANGRVGINTSNPQELLDVNGDARLRGQVVVGNVTAATPAGYSLVVGQGILAERVRVAIQGTIYWADFVFDEQYKLKPLHEVEQFVKSNKHLPGIQPAAAIAKEGYDVSVMDAKLLEKIEELTLYIIELNKKNEALEQKVKALATPSKAN